MRPVVRRAGRRLRTGRLPVAPPLVALVVAVASVAGCGDRGPEPQARTGLPVSTRAPSPAPAPIPAEVRELMDEGYAAFEAGNLSGALRSYEAAVEVDSTVAAAWFGVYMTYDALGETARAREIRERIIGMSAPTPGDPHAAFADDGPPSLETSAAEEEGA